MVFCCCLSSSLLIHSICALCYYFLLCVLQTKPCILCFKFFLLLVAVHKKRCTSKTFNHIDVNVCRRTVRQSSLMGSSFNIFYLQLGKILQHSKGKLRLGVLNPYGVLLLCLSSSFLIHSINALYYCFLLCVLQTKPCILCFKFFLLLVAVHKKRCTSKTLFVKESTVCLQKGWSAYVVLD
jgi:hypothetical protein